MPINEKMKVYIDYTNYKGERRIRHITPIRLLFTKNQWHGEEQWLLTAMDEETGYIRQFAVKDIHQWSESRDGISFNPAIDVREHKP